MNTFSDICSIYHDFKLYELKAIRVWAIPTFSGRPFTKLYMGLPNGLFLG